MKIAFNQLKDDLANSTLLSYPDPSAQLSIQTDASRIAVGAVLQQFQNQKKATIKFFLPETDNRTMQL